MLLLLRRTGHYVAYVQRGATMPSTYAAHFQSDVAEDRAAVRQSSMADAADHPGQPHIEQANGLDRARAAEAPVSVAGRQYPKHSTAEPSVSASCSPVKGADGSQSSSGESPKPEALSWFLCTDEIMKPVSWDAVAKCKAYILLYTRIE